MAIGIQEIADKAGVTKGTVSKVLNNYPGISEQTRQRVSAAASELNYHPRAPGPVETRNHSWKIVLIAGRGGIMEGTVDVFGQYLFAARDRLTERRHIPSICAGIGQADRDILFDRMVHEHNADGAILLGVYEEDGYLDRTIHTGLPIVVINRYPEHGEFSYVAPDNFGGGRTAAEHLIELGHRRLAVVRGDELHFDNERVAGFCSGAEEAGLPTPLELKYNWKQGNRSIADIATTLVKQRVTGAFLTNDHSSQLVGDELLERGIRIPDDLSMVGFDNLDTTLANGRVVTSVSYNLKAIGQAAADMLLELLEDRGEDGAKSRALIYKARLAVHDTTMAATGAEEVLQESARS